jgi:hypothetical protein
MGDPVVAKNAKRIPPAHRIDNVTFGRPQTLISCACGWEKFWEYTLPPNEVEAAWLEHRRDMKVEVA